MNGYIAGSAVTPFTEGMAGCTGDSVELVGRPRDFSSGRADTTINVGRCAKVSPEEVEAVLLKCLPWRTSGFTPRNPITGELVAAEVVLQQQ